MIDYDAMTNDQLALSARDSARQADALIKEFGWDNAAVAVCERQAERAIRILQSRDPATATAIAKELGWPKS